MVIHVKRAGYLPPWGWQLCRVISGSFRVKWVAALPCNQWQLCREIRSGGKVPVHPVSRLRQSLITHRRPALAAPPDSLYFKLSHQSLYRTTCHFLAFSFQLMPDLPRAVHLVILIPHAIDRLRQRPVPLHPGRYACRVRVPGLVLVVRRRGDRHACISARPLAQPGVGR